jgi:group I intron endonuclease
VENTSNGKFYVGQTHYPLSVRWSQHRHNAKRGTNIPLSAAIRKYGANAFVVHELGTAETQSLLDEMEIAIIDLLDSAKREHGYNLAKGGKGRAGYKMSPSFGLSVSARMKGTKRSLETRQKMSLTLVGNQRGKNCQSFLGRKHSDENKRRWSAMKQGAANPNFGKRHSEETKQKCREAAQRQALARQAARQVEI